MTFSTDIDGLDEFLQEVNSLFKNPKSNLSNNDFLFNLNVQAPIKGTFYNSGAFSTSPTDSRHPQGHMGVDMRAAAGTPIYPFASGIITNVGTDPKGGNVVNIQHANGLKTYYAHMGAIRVHKGDRVDNNTVIGVVGDTGNAKGTIPHLHFQVWENGQIQNPEKYFSMPPYTQYDANKEKFWLSDNAKQEITNFNINQHVNNKSLANSKIEKIVKLADYYYKLALDN